MISGGALVKASRRRPSRAILHVAESFGGGVGAAIQDYVQQTPEYEHHLLFGEREDAPVPDAFFAPFARWSKLPTNLVGAILTTQKEVRRGSYAAVHAHSSFGGVYARLATLRTRTRIVYTPHCYAFERTDVSAGASFFYLTIERILALNTSAFAACSPREASLSAHWRSPADVVFVPNVAPDDGALVSRPPNDSSAMLRIVGAGRAGKQKDPDFFFACVDELRRNGFSIDATWVGGDSELTLLGEKRGVRVTGWLPRSEALREIAGATLYVHTAAWEGFPIAVLEAASMGVPTIVRAIPAFDDLDLPKVTAPADLAHLLRADGSRRIQIEYPSRLRAALSPFNRRAQRAGLLRAYGYDDELP